jgi:hypothetical protein
MLVKLKRFDGSVAVMNISENEDVQKEISKYEELHQEKILGFDFIDFVDIPSDRTFRNAWDHDFKVNMVRARDIWRTKLRSDRQPLLATLDVEFMKALETNADTKPILDKKQILRDLPADPRIDAAETLEDLKAITING